MKQRFKDYKTIVFDCDGVLLDSNRVKSDAFYKAVLEYGEEAARGLLKHHRENGGVSRYKKFDYFFDHILKMDNPMQEKKRALELYSSHVWDGLLKCKSEPHLEELKRNSPDSTWLIVSGGDQKELRKVFSERKCDGLFQGGIFGSPDTKDEILAREVNAKNITFPALFIGDSKYDYIAAKGVGLDFIFVSQWTEVSDWQKWIKDNGIESIESLKGILC